jgi:hypothetical protein
MTRVLVNNEPQNVDTGLKTWGELLAWVDGRWAGEGQLVTAARLDGVDEPSFRDPAQSARALSEWAVVEVEVATPASLVSESLQEALDGLRSLRQYAVAVGHRFRGTDMALANRGLGELSQGLQTLVGLIDALGSAIGVRLDALEWEGRSTSALLDDLGETLGNLGAAQAAEDWVTVADILEFDLEPALAQCEPFFRALSELAQQAGQRPH